MFTIPMNLYAVHYIYDERFDERMALRPEHLEYLDALVADGRLLAYGRFTDDLAPGALFIYLGDTPEQVDAMVEGDPFVSQGFVPHHFVRTWPARGTWPALLETEA